MNKSLITAAVSAALLFSFSPAYATSSAFWDTLHSQKTTHKSAKRFYRPRTKLAAPRKGRIKTSKVKSRKSARRSTRSSASCYVKAAARLPSTCIKKNRATRKGILSQIGYLKKEQASSRKGRGVRHANHTQLGHGSLLNTAKGLLDWFDDYHGESLASNFDLHELDPRTGKVKYTGYFTPFIAARKHPTRDYRHPIYALPTGRLPTRDQVFRGALRGKGLEIAWTNDPVGYYQAQVQGSGVLAFPNNKMVDLHFAGKTSADFVSVASYMLRKGYIKNPSNKEMRRWLLNNPKKLKRVLAVNPRFVFFKARPHKARRTTASGQALIAGHTVAVDTRHIPFGSVLLAEIPLRNRKGKVVGRDWRLVFPQDRGAAIKGVKRLDLYTGEGIVAKKMTNKVTGVGRAFLLVKKQSGGRFRKIAFN